VCRPGCTWCCKPPAGTDDTDLQRRLAERGVNAPTLSGHARSAGGAPFPGLVLGYASSSPVRAAVGVIADSARGYWLGGQGEDEGPETRYPIARRLVAYAIGASDAAQYRSDDAQYNGPVAVDDVVIRVARLEIDVAVAAAIHLDGSLVIDHRGDDLAGVSLGLLSHHDDIAVADRGVDHGVAAHTQTKDGSTPGKFPGQREKVIDMLVG
jgi:hypothetical protein